MTSSGRFPPCVANRLQINHSPTPSDVSSVQISSCGSGSPCSTTAAKPPRPTGFLEPFPVPKWGHYQCLPSISVNGLDKNEDDSCSIAAPSDSVTLPSECGDKSLAPPSTAQSHGRSSLSLSPLPELSPGSLSPLLRVKGHGKRALSVSPLSSEGLDLTQLIRTSPNSLIAFVNGCRSTPQCSSPQGTYGHLCKSTWSMADKSPIRSPCRSPMKSPTFPSSPRLPKSPVKMEVGNSPEDKENTAPVDDAMQELETSGGSEEQQTLLSNHLIVQQDSNMELLQENDVFQSQLAPPITSPQQEDDFSDLSQIEPSIFRREPISKDAVNKLNITPSLVTPKNVYSHSLPASSSALNFESNSNNSNLPTNSDAHFVSQQQGQATTQSFPIFVNTAENIFPPIQQGMFKTEPPDYQEYGHSQDSLPSNPPPTYTEHVIQHCDQQGNDTYSGAFVCVSKHDGFSDEYTNIKQEDFGSFDGYGVATSLPIKTEDQFDCADNSPLACKWIDCSAIYTEQEDLVRHIEKVIFVLEITWELFVGSCKNSLFHVCPFLFGDLSQMVINNGNV